MPCFPSQLGGGREAAIGSAFSVIGARPLLMVLPLHFLFGLSGPVAGAVIEPVVLFIRRSSKRYGNAQ